MENAALIRVSNLSLFEAATINHMDVYVARTDAQHKSGLAGLTKLDKAGMLFVYEEPSSTSFTMTRMLFDLDVSFYDKDGTLLKQGTYNAGFAGPVFCRDYSYVLESPAGFGHPESLDVAVVTDDVKPVTMVNSPSLQPASYVGDVKAQDRVGPVGSGEAVKEGAAGTDSQVGSGPWDGRSAPSYKGVGGAAQSIPGRSASAPQSFVPSTPIPGTSTKSAPQSPVSGQPVPGTPTEGAPKNFLQSTPIPDDSKPAPRKEALDGSTPIPGSGSSAEQEGAQMGDQPGMPSGPAQTFLP